MGYRATMPRQAVLAELEKAEDHLTAKEIFVSVQRLCPACGLNTVYRTLEMLIASGLARKSDFGDGQARYELTSRPGRPAHHHHLLCVRCGKVVDYEDFMEEEKVLFDRIETGLSKKFDFSITGHELTFKGICGDCAANIRR
jgi:Fur family ferric uptake transcriptional regulator